MKTRNLNLSVVFLLAGFFCGCGGEKNILLKLKYDKNARIDIKYRYYMVTNDEDDEPLINEYIRMGWTVDSIFRDSSYQFSAKIDYVRIKNKGLLPILDEEYSSDRDTSEMGAAEKQLDHQVRPALNASYKFTLDKYGKIIKPFSLENSTVLLENNSFIDLGIYQIAFPDHKIAIGEKWDNDQAIAGTKKKRSATYHIESIYDSTIQIKVDGKAWDEDGNLSHFSGRYFLDKTTCKLVSCKIERKGKIRGTGDFGKAVISIEAN